MHFEPDREQHLIELMAHYDEFLADETSKTRHETPGVNGDSELAEEWTSTKACLDLLDRVRRRWSPNEASDDELDVSSTGELRMLGRFRLERSLGSGGLGIVYLAFDPKLGRRIALKVPRVESLVSAELRRRFVREAEAAARLNHPNLVTVHDAGEEGLVCYIAAEYCEGPNLAEWLAARMSPVPLRAAAQLVKQLSEAVQHAHSRGVLHRDIKPGNVLMVSAVASDRANVSGPPTEFIAKLTDFGMAKMLESSTGETRSGSLIGTFAYMAPEQARGATGDLDARVDVYALGAVLYELLTGHKAITGATDVDTLRQVVEQDPIPPRQLRTEIPRDLEAICLKSLTKERDGRYATAQQMVEDLGRFLDGKPTEARPSNIPERFWKWARRRPAAAALVSVTCAAFASVFTIATFYSMRLSHEVETSRQLLYSADTRLASEAIQANRVPEALKHLHRHRAERGKRDLREFTWHYLHGRCQQEIMNLHGHNGEVNAVTFSPLGELLATCGKDGTARIWNARTGDCLLVLKGHDGAVNAAAFSTDGAMLITVGDDKTIRLWDPVSGRQRKVIEGHTDEVYSIALSPDGHWLASGGLDRDLVVWDLARSTVAVKLSTAGDVRAMAFSPNGALFVAGDEIGAVHCWRTLDWQSLVGALCAEEDALALAFSSDSQVLVGAGRIRSIHRWKLNEQGLQPDGDLALGHAKRIQALAFSPLDDTLASASWDGVMRFQSLRDGSIRTTMAGHSDRVRSVAWSPDGLLLASAGANGEVKVWQAKRLIAGLTPYSDCAAPIAEFEFVPEGNSIATASFDGYVRFWDLELYRPTRGHKVHPDGAFLVRCCPQGDYIASRSVDGSTVVWNKLDGKAIYSLPAGHSKPGVLDWSPDGKLLATTIDECTVVVVDSQTGSIRKSINHSTRVRSVDFSRDGERLATDSRSALKIWDFLSDELLLEVPDVRFIEFSPDGSTFVAVDEPKTMLLDSRTGELLQTLVGNDGDDHLLAAFSPDGRTLASATQRKPLRLTLWDVRTGQELAEFPCTGSRIERIDFSPSGDRLIAAGEGEVGIGRLWEWRVTTH